MKNPPHPGGYIKEFIMEPLGLSVAEAASALQMTRQNLSRVINGHGAITAELALKLEKAFGVEAGTTLRMQAIYDEAKARKESRTITKGIKRHPAVAA
ncbi:MAG: HigA family addiction module antidote protein [Alphaproteobacteria bacterium GM202ARS2]|nr:HigA family addiction module antidote protein [Alphaproteobacteria bacterium GM202ARS2]